MTTVEDPAPAAVQHVSTIVVIQLAFALLVGGGQEWPAKLILTLATLCVSVVAWMFVGYGVYHSEGPSFIGRSDVLQGMRDTADMDHVISQLGCICTASAIIGAGASARVRTRALAALIFITASVGAPISARAAWNPKGIFTQTGASEFLSEGVGVVDSGGGGIIHCTAGTATLVLSYFAQCWVPENVSDSEGAAPRESAQSVFAGTLLMWLGTMMLHSVTTSHWQQHYAQWIDDQAVTATMVSGASGCLALVLFKPVQDTGVQVFSALHTFSLGARAAVVACAASCTTVPLWTQLISGPLASILGSWLDTVLQRRGLRDVAGIVAVHLCGGAIGVLSVGIFAAEDLLIMLPWLPKMEAVQYSKGIAMGGGGQQLAVQIAWLLFIICWTAVFTASVCMVLCVFGVLVKTEAHMQGTRKHQTRSQEDSILKATRMFICSSLLDKMPDESDMGCATTSKEFSCASSHLRNIFGASDISQDTDRSRLASAQKRVCKSSTRGHTTESQDQWKPVQGQLNLQRSIAACQVLSSVFRPDTPDDQAPRDMVPELQECHRTGSATQLASDAATDDNDVTFSLDKAPESELCRIARNASGCSLRTEPLDRGGTNEHLARDTLHVPARTHEPARSFNTYSASVLAAESYGKPRTLASLTPSLLRQEVFGSQGSTSMPLGTSPDDVHGQGSSEGVLQVPQNNTDLLKDQSRLSESSLVAVDVRNHSPSDHKCAPQHSPKRRPPSHTSGCNAKDMTDLKDEAASECLSSPTLLKIPAADLPYSPMHTTRASCLSTRTSAASKSGKPPLTPGLNRDAPPSAAEERSGSDGRQEDPSGTDGSPAAVLASIDGLSNLPWPPARDVSRPAFRQTAFTSEPKASVLPLGEPPMGVEYCVRPRQSALLASSEDLHGTEAPAGSSINAFMEPSGLASNQQHPASSTQGLSVALSSLSDPWSSQQRNKYTMHSRSKQEGAMHSRSKQEGACASPASTVDAIFVSQAKQAQPSRMNSPAPFSSTVNSPGGYGSIMSHSSAFNSKFGTLGSKPGLKHSLSRTYQPVTSRTYTFGVSTSRPPQAGAAYGANLAPYGAGAAYGADLAPYGAGAAYGTHLAPYGAGGVEPSTSSYRSPSKNQLARTSDAGSKSRAYDASSRNQRLHQTFRFPESRSTGDYLHQGAADLNRTGNSMPVRTSFDMKHTTTMSPVTAAIALAHECMSRPESSANVFAQLQALDSAHKHERFS